MGHTYNKNIYFIDVPCKLIQGHDFQPLHYRAPEILMGVEFDTKVDMWGFGIMISELFKGTVPFQGMNDVQMLGVLIQTFGSFPLEMIIASPRTDNYTRKDRFNQVIHEMHMFAYFPRVYA